MTMPVDAVDAAAKIMAGFGLFFRVNSISPGPASSFSRKDQIMTIHPGQEMKNKALERIKNQAAANKNGEEPIALELGWHPFAELFQNLQGEEWAAFKASIKKTKGAESPGIYRVINGQRQGIDGRLRWQAHEELGLPPPRMVEKNIPDEEVKEFICRRNAMRRGKPSHEERLPIILNLRADGKSTREIAQMLGLSQATINSDLNSGEQICSPENDEKSTEVHKPQEEAAKSPNMGQAREEIAKEEPVITGRDGKKYRSRKKPKTRKEKAAEGMTPGEEEEILDGEGRPVPEAFREIFKARVKYKEALNLAKDATAIVEALCDTPAGVWLHKQSVLSAAKEFEAQCRYGAPYCLCPKCGGEKRESKCADCRGRGYMTRAILRASKISDKVLAQ